VRRSELEIIADILKAAEEGSRKTRLVYRTNLNFKLLKRYLRKLLEYGFIRIEDGFIRIEGRFYTTTSKGAQFLDNYRQLMFPLKEIDSKRIDERVGHLNKTDYPYNR
jgi:predicted transcriptional regulator